MAYGYGPDLNVTMPGDIAPGSGLGLGAYATSPLSPVTGGPTSTTQQQAPYGLGHPLLWGALIIFGFLFVGWLAGYLGKGEDYANTKVSAVTIIVTGASAVFFLYILRLSGAGLQNRIGPNGFSGFTASL